MPNSLNEIYNLELKIITPVHIGSGDKIPKTELGYFPEQKLLSKINLDRFFESIPPNKITTISQILRTAENDYFNNLIKSANLSLKTEHSDYNLNFFYEYNSDDITKLRELSSHIKNPFYKPYIPGSTLKGWLRTAILYYYLKRVKEAKNLIDAFYDELDDLPRNPKLLYKIKIKIAKILEDKIFGEDPREDIFKFITIGDTEVISEDHLKLALIQHFHPTEIQGQLQFQSLKFSQYMEALEEQTMFSSKIIISKDLSNYKKEFLKLDDFSTKIRNFIFKDLIELNHNDFIKRLSEISNILSKGILEYNYFYLTTLGKEIKSSHLEKLIEFYDNNLFPLYDTVSESGNRFLLRLGAATDWPSKTVGLEIMDYFLKRNDISFNEFYDKINKLEIFDGQIMHKHFKLMPISRAYVVDLAKNPRCPLGWVQAQLS